MRRPELPANRSLRHSCLAAWDEPDDHPGLLPTRCRGKGRRRKASSRRGITILIVLMLISVTLALSYSILRSQMTTVLIQNNNVRNNNARQDAISGLTIAMREMSDGTWKGVGSALAAHYRRPTTTR